MIGVGHKARQGKDLFARALAELRPDLVQRFAFADGVRVLARVRHGMTRKDAPLLQRVGVLERAGDPEVWIRALYWALEETRPAIAVIPDVRFENEAQFVRQLGGILVRVQRLRPDGAPYIDPSRPADHISETALDGWDGWDYQVAATTPDEVRARAAEILRDVLLFRLAS